MFKEAELEKRVAAGWVSRFQRAAFQPLAKQREATSKGGSFRFVLGVAGALRFKASVPHLPGNSNGQTSTGASGLDCMPRV